MPRILLIVTGRLEEVALAQSLGRLFPDAEFVTQWVQGFTSDAVKSPDPEFPTKADAMVDKLLGAAYARDPGGRPFDYALAFEDVELANEPDPGPGDGGVERILQHVQHGIDWMLKREADARQPVIIPMKGRARKSPPPSTDAQRRQFLRERCSFHLFRPMPEAMFFGDPQGVSHVLGPGAASRVVHFDPKICDVEQFRTDDPGYLGPVDKWKPDGQTEAPWAKARRGRHPKHYLEYLIDPLGMDWRPYREKEHGARALIDLDWKSVVMHDQHAQMVRALLDDVADMTGTALPWLRQETLHPLTSRKEGGRLRNVS